MLHAAKEKTKSSIKKSNVMDQLLRTPKKIGDFYASPVKAKDSKGSSIKSVSAASSVSTTKKFSIRSNRTLTELEILENFQSEESDIEYEDKTAVNAKKASKIDDPAEKTIATVDNKPKIPVTSPSTEFAKAKLKKKESKEPLAKSLVKPHLNTPKEPEKVCLNNLPPGNPFVDSSF